MRASETTTPPANGVAPPERPVPAPRATNGTPLAVARAEHGLHLLGRAGEDDELGDGAVAGQPVALVRPELLGLRDDVLRAERTLSSGDEVGRERHAATIGLPPCCRSSVPGRSSASGSTTATMRRSRARSCRRSRCSSRSGRRR